MFMDFAMLPPEVNSTRMYSGPGAGSLWAAAAAWDQVSAELQSAAETYRFGDRQPHRLAMAGSIVCEDGCGGHPVC